MKSPIRCPIGLSRSAPSTAFLAGGYSGVVGAWEQAKQGRFDIDFLMIAAALGAALIDEWVEGALLLFLFTLSGALETFAMGRTRKAIEALGKAASRCGHRAPRRSGSPGAGGASGSRGSGDRQAR